MVGSCAPWLAIRKATATGADEGERNSVALLLVVVVGGGSGGEVVAFAAAAPAITSGGKAGGGASLDPGIEATTAAAAEVFAVVSAVPGLEAVLALSAAVAVAPAVADEAAKGVKVLRSLAHSTRLQVNATLGLAT